MSVPLSYIESICAKPKMNAEQLLQAGAQALAKKSARERRDAEAAGDRFALLAFLAGRARGPFSSSEPSRLTILLSAQMLLTQLLAEAVAEIAPPAEEAERKSHPEACEEARQLRDSEPPQTPASASQQATRPAPENSGVTYGADPAGQSEAGQSSASSSHDSQSSSSSSLLGVSTSAGFGEGDNMPAEFKRKLRALKCAVVEMGGQNPRTLEAVTLDYIARLEAWLESFGGAHG